MSKRHDRQAKPKPPQKHILNPKTPEDEEIERLTRERDEARAKYSDLLDNVGDHVKEAHRHGFERGVREAANHKELYGLSSIRRAILALLEPNLQEQSK
jgi:hypothetical protein